MTIDPAVWALSAAHPELRPEWLRRRMLPVPKRGKKYIVPTSPRVSRQIQAMLRAIAEHRGRTGHVSSVFLRKELPPEIRVQPTIDEIIRCCTKFYGLTSAEMMSERRTARIVRARMVAAYLCCKLTTRSLPTIGHRFNRDHTTILHARQVISERIGADAQLREEVQTLMQHFARECAIAGEAA